MSKMIKDYKIIKILGKGTYAIAYLVEKTESNITRNYVIKQIKMKGKNSKLLEKLVIILVIKENQIKDY